MKYTLTTSDFLRGLLIAVGSGVLVLLGQMFTNRPVVINWGEIGATAVSAAITYLLKNFFTDDVKKAKNTLIAEAANTAEARKVESIETKK